MFVKHQESFEAKCRGCLLSIFSLVIVPFFKNEYGTISEKSIGVPILNKVAP